MRSFFSTYPPAVRLKVTNWLHPAGWLVWVTILVFIGFFILGGATTTAGTFLSWSGYIQYVLLIGALLLPFALFRIEPVLAEWDKQWKLPLKSPAGLLIVGLYFLLILIRVASLPEWQYEQIRFFTPPSLYLTSFSGWLLAGMLFWQLLLRNHRVLSLVIIVLELGLIIHIGYREWAVWFILMIALIISTSYRKIRNREFLLLIAVFLLIFSPLHNSYRSAASYVNGLDEIEQAETSVLAETPRYFSNYPDFVSRTLERLRAEAAMTARIIEQVPGETEFRSTRKLLSETGTVVVPRVLWPEKPGFRPGEEVYNTFISGHDDLRRTHPTGWLGDMYWHWGWAGIPAAFLFGSVLILIWNYYARYVRWVPAWFVSHYALIFGFTQSHLIFFSTAWLRILPLYLLAGLLIWIWTHHQTLYIGFIRNK